MAEQVVAAAGTLPVTVVCDDLAVVEWAEDLGVDVAWTPGLGLDGAVEAGVDAVARAGAAPGDRRPRRPAAGARPGRAAPARATRSCSCPTGTTTAPTSPSCRPPAGFRFAYGPGSFARHGAEAERLGLAAPVVRDPRLGWDVDLPADLDLPTDAELLRAASSGCP